MSTRPKIRQRKRPVFYQSPRKLEFSRGLRNNPTKSEEALWNRLKSRQLNETFIRQRIILGWIVDFYCPSKKLAIEVDGPYHLWGAKEKDILRDKALLRVGIRTLRVTNSDILLRMEETLSIIREEINR